MKKCNEGHFYDDSQLTECPFCNRTAYRAGTNEAGGNQGGFNPNSDFAANSFNQNANSPYRNKTATSPKSHRIGRMVVTFVICFALGVVGGLLRSSHKNSKKTNKPDVPSIDVTNMLEYNEVMSKMEVAIANYTPGIHTETGYTSEFFGFEFTADENCLMYGDSELEEESRIRAENSRKNAFESVEKYNLDEEQFENFMDSMYIQTETGAFFFDETGNLGALASFSVMSNATDSLSIAQELKSSFESDGNAVEISEAEISGEKYVQVRYSAVIDGLKENHVLYLRSKGGMQGVWDFCFIDGYEYMHDLFLNCLS